MSEKILFFELFQPFAQYRNPFTFYYAQTFPLPPKSTVIGMLQNACDDWYGNKFGINNWWNLKVSIHGGFESIFWNYQQLIKGELGFTKEGIWVNNNSEMEKRYGKGIYLPLYGTDVNAQRSPVYQQELFNGHLYIFIKAVDDKQIEILEEIKKSLNKPKKVLSLGRSEDVVFIKDIREIEERSIFSKTVKKSLWLTFPTYIKLDGFPISNQKFPVYSIPVEVKFKNKKESEEEKKEEYEYVKHKSEITKQTERDVAFETAIYSAPENPIYLDESKGPIEVDIIKLGENKIFKIPKDYGWL